MTSEDAPGTGAEGAWSPDATVSIETLAEAIRARGLTPRGAFHPGPDDGVPALASGHATGTLVLVGNAGDRMWQRFCRDRDPGRDLLDDWSVQIIGALAAAVGAHALFPFAHPALPFQRWARRAEGCEPSPLGLSIHPVYGLWHGYRGALAFAARLALAPARARQHPCDHCADKPCLSACPVHAFNTRAHDLEACTVHLAHADGEACMDGGCLARRACPIGREYVYPPAQVRFHMRHFLCQSRPRHAPLNAPD